MARHTDAVAVSRRSVIAGLGSVAGGLAATGSAVAQEQGVTARAALPAADQYENKDLAGFFVHVDPDPDAISARLSEECQYADWPPEETMAYEVLLINRKSDNHFSVETQLYVPDRRTIPDGGLYVINRMHECASSYIGIEIEQIAADVSVIENRSPSGEGADDPGGVEEETSGSGPGLGVLAALAGLAGAGGLARWRDQK